MKKQNFPVARLFVLSSALFLSLFAMSFSCQDHVVPERPVPARITTLNPAVTNRTVTFSLQFSTLGTVPITEYGIVFFSEDLFTPPGQIPVLDAAVHDLIKFTEPFNLDVHINTRTFDPDVKKVHYKAYAKLSNGSTAYGELKVANLDN
ncbi:hypothetical protein [Dyadobacter luticola]|uniref:DUF4625 domain-containing protein n=1 Tax=Dyadobacter luticola TaxID=1979387 RepID=A0A5R9L4T0_9BACT|nr:hypothetical protein [Dyadobacter luticola]TLV03596.1 hypothetical protein FEN17_08335 [Dyadobacter luticola]